MHFGSCDLDLVLVHRKRNPRPTRNDGVWGIRQIVGPKPGLLGAACAGWVGVGGATQEGPGEPQGCPN
jgi:hypothetical protein